MNDLNEHMESCHNCQDHPQEPCSAVQLLSTSFSSTISAMEIFFANYCNDDGGIQVPDCRGCEHNLYAKGCMHSENPMNKMLLEVGK
jgi:hypothetical protein